MLKKRSLFKKTVTACMLAVTLTSAPAQSAAANETTAVTVQADVQNGWKKEAVGYCYYEGGQKLTNQWKTIKGKEYYLGSNGARKTGWYTIKNKSYYFDSKGVLKKSKKIDSSLVKYMDKVIKTLKITDDTDKEKALNDLFTYVEKKYGYARVVGFTGKNGWEYTYAKQMLSKKKGSCYHYAAAFAFLAKRATGLPVRICWGTSNAFNKEKWQPHAWVEIKIGKTWYTYDANASKFSSLRKGKWYRQKHTSMEGKIYKTQKYVNVEL